MFMPPGAEVPENAVPSLGGTNAGASAPLGIHLLASGTLSAPSAHGAWKSGLVFLSLNG